MLLTDEQIEDMKLIKWNVLYGLDNKEAIFEFLRDAYKTPKDKDYIYHAIAVITEAIKVYNIQITDPEDAASLAEDAASIRSGIPITYDDLVSPSLASA